VLVLIIRLFIKLAFPSPLIRYALLIRLRISCFKAEFMLFRKGFESYLSLIQSVKELD
jgi:hypothetical protein